MAKPTVAERLWNATDLQLTLRFSEAVTYTGSAGSIIFTASNLTSVYRNTGAPSSGDGTATHVYTLSLYPAGTPSTEAQSYDMAAATVTNGTAETNDAIDDELVNSAVNHTAPYNRTDLSNLATKLLAVFSSAPSTAPNTTLGIAATADAAALVTNLIGSSGTNTLLLAPREMAKAREAIAAFHTFRRSSRDAAAFDALDRAMAALQAAMPKDGQTFPFAITSTGT